VKITYLYKREGEKRCRGMILALNHPFLADEEEIRVLTDGSQKREGERK